MTQTHTPGPWVATGWESCTVNSAAGFTIVAFPGGNGGETGRLSLAEAKANARLIAAAPDMLAALKMAREYFNGAHIIAGDVEQAVCAAIAKAAP